MKQQPENEWPQGKKETLQTEDGMIHSIISVDLKILLEKLNGNRDLISRCLSLFQKETPVLLRSIETALDQHNFTEIKKACHNLRGSLMTMEMHPASGSALEIERLAEKRETGKTYYLLELLNTEIKKAVSTLDHFLSEAPS